MEEFFSYFINVIASSCASLKVFFVSNFSQLTGIIGASAWFAPWVYQKFVRPDVKCQLMSIHGNPGIFIDKECTMHFLALNIISLNKEFHINMTKTQISTKYFDDMKIYPCEQFWARSSEWAGPNCEQVKLKILPEQTLLFTSSLPKDVATKVYVLFKHEETIDTIKLERISITLVDYSNKKHKFVFNRHDIDVEKIVWDDRIWVPIKNV